MNQLVSSGRERPASAGLRIDATMVLTLYLGLLIVLPSQWVLPKMGAPGAPASVGALCLFGWWALSRGRSPKGSFRPSYHMWVALFVAFLAIMLTTVLAFSRHLTANESSGAIRGFIRFCGLLGVALAAMDGPRNLKRLVTLLDRFVTCIAVMALVGITQYFTDFDPVRWIRIPGLELNGELSGVGTRSSLSRISSTMAHAIEYGAILATAVPIALHFVLFPLDGRSNWARLRFAIIGVALPLSVSRTAFLVMFVAVAMMWTAWSWRRRINLLGASIVFAGAFRSVAPGILGTIKSLIFNFGNDPSVSGRTADFAILNEYIAERPFFGRGYGTFGPQDYFFVDNQVMLLIVSSGVVGALAILGLLVTATASARQVYWHGPNDATRHLGASVAAALVATTSGFFTYDALSFAGQAGVFYFLVGMAGGLHRLSTTSGRVYTNERSLDALRPAHRPETDTDSQPTTRRGDAPEDVYDLNPL